MKPVLLIFLIILALTACEKNTSNPSFTPRATNAGQFVDTVALEPVITGERVLTSDTLYILNGYCYVSGNAMLLIEEGARIEANPGAALVITSGSRIYAEGSSTNPIIFTSHLSNPYAGSWYGILVLGNAPVNQPNATFESLPYFAYQAGVPANVDVHYGVGNNVYDDSGVLRYLRIEYAGAMLPGSQNDENELDGLTCAGVGNNTVLEYIEVAKCGGDAFQFYGGTVNAKYLFAWDPYKDAFDFDLGYIGRIQYAVSAVDYSTYHLLPCGIESHTYNGSAHGSTYPAIPNTEPIISNITVIGLGDSVGAGSLLPLGRSAWFDKSSSYQVRNCVFMAYPGGLNLGTGMSLTAVNNFRNNIIHGYSDRVFPPSLLATVHGNNNKTYSGIHHNDSIGLTSPFLDRDFRPVAGSPALTLGTSFTGLAGYPGFFDSTSFRGAFNSNDNWLAGWSKSDY